MEEEEEVGEELEEEGRERKKEKENKKKAKKKEKEQKETREVGESRKYPALKERSYRGLGTEGSALVAVASEKLMEKKNPPRPAAAARFFHSLAHFSASS